MPLLPGNDQATISRNIGELTHHGTRSRSHDQIVAIALSNAARHPHHASGGGIGHIAGGLGVHVPPLTAPKPQMVSPSQGAPWWTRAAAHEMTVGGHSHLDAGGEPMSQATPWWTRSEARQIDDVPHGGGLIDSSGAGRTDRLPLAVASESHVLPADSVSAAGQGNSLAGARILNMALRTGPWGVPLPHEIRGHGPPAAPHMAAGALGAPITGAAEGGAPRTTSILAAGGEVVVPPEDVAALGQRGMAQGLAKRNESAMDCGHRLLDEMIARIRKYEIAWLRHAPAPKK